MAAVQRPWPANPRAVLAAMYANRPAGEGLGVTFGGQGIMIPDIPLDQIGTPAHTGIYRQDNVVTRTNEDARIPDGWELFGPTLGIQTPPVAGTLGVVQCIIKIADRGRIRYVPPREKVPQQWFAIGIDSDRMPDLLDQGWKIYETPYVGGGGRILVTLVKSPPAIPPAPAAVNIPPNVPPAAGGTRRRKRNRKVHRKTISK